MSEAPAPSSRSASPGFWQSDFGAAEAVAATRELSELQAADAGVFWLAIDPASALQRLWRWQPAQGDRAEAAQAFSPAGQSIRSRVNEYGGGSFCIGDTAVFFVDEGDQQVYRQTLDGRAAAPLTHAPGCRFGDLFYDRSYQRILCVREAHAEHSAKVTQELVAIDSRTGELTLFAGGADFYASPRVDNRGTRAAWIEWSVEHMPWDSTRLATATLKPDTGLPGFASRDQAGAFSTSPLQYPRPGDSGSQSILQPRFDADGHLWCLSDHQGWWQLYRLDEDNHWHCFDDEAADRALPPSQLGHQQYAILPGRRIASTKLQQGWMQLEVQGADQAPTRRLLADHALFRYLAWHQDRLYCVAGAPGHTTAVVRIDPESGEHQVLAGGDRPLPEADIARPEAFSFPVAATTRAHGFFYRPTNSREPGGQDRPAPLIIMTHGGPTSATYAVFNPMVQFWTQRGFAVADLNYRGSSGFGRAYRQALHHRWGLADVEDVLAALDELERRNWCDTGRAFIRGSSAGGFTTLSLMVAHGDRFLAGCSLYGVSDPWALRQVTHRFESRYLDWLIADGSHPEQFQARSPLARAGEIKTPMIFFQGGRDNVVVPAQTEAMVAALQSTGLEVRYHYYPEEGHGFRQPETRKHALEEELRFFRDRLHIPDSLP